MSYLRLLAPLSTDVPPWISIVIIHFLFRDLRATGAALDGIGLDRIDKIDRVREFKVVHLVTDT